MARHWIVVGGKEIYDTTKEMGFTRHGLKSTRRKMVQQIQPGDTVSFYISGRKQLAGMVRVTRRGTACTVAGRRPAG